jgi:PTS system nitrogen regulatory IIA component
MDLKIKDVAELLNVSETTIRRWLVKGLIPAYRLNHQFRFSRIEIENWVMSCKMEDGPEIKPASTKKPTSWSGTQQFSLFRAIHKGQVLVDAEGDDKEDLIKNSMQIIAKENDWDADVVTDLLLDRESLMPTALNHGIGVPHTRDFILPKSSDVISVCFPKDPIEYGALDGQKVHSLFFLFACEDKSHLHLLAKLAHLASSEDALEFLQTKPDKTALLQFIKAWESKFVQEPKLETV